jgi:transcriptional regulator with GAF, ATPase, and Fis domain
MARIRLEVLNGDEAGRVFESDADVVRIGRAPECELRLAAAHLSGRQARLTATAGGFSVEGEGGVNGSALLQGGSRVELSLGVGRHPLHSGDELELGGDSGEPLRLRVTLGAEPPPPEVVTTRSLQELRSPPGSLDPIVWAAVLRALGATESLEAAVAEVAEAALRLSPRATHATVALIDDLQAEKGLLLPMVTRVRGAGGAPVAPEGPVALTRSVARRVVEGRAAVLAADAPRESLGSESLLGANIRSTIGVPLWKGDDILGVLQVDNRDAPAMFDRRDVEALGVLAHGASLAVANARLIQKLTLAEEQLRGENQFLRRRSRGGEQRIVGESRRMEQVLAQLDKVVDTRVTVLVEGETGTGKELFASAIHYRSNRRDKLFVAQNCAAFPENLLESELFGHKRGSFTGATEDKKGLFEIADGGTLFLDEVGEMPLSLQAKLLRVLQEGEVRPLGAPAARRVNVRIVAATNRNLEKEVAEGRFREDLYYRLKVFPLRVPPLRERREDVPLLAAHFLERYTREFGRELAGFTQPALELLRAYDWPGNVRELENEVQRAVIQAEGETFVTPELLSPRVRNREGGSTPAPDVTAPSPGEEDDAGGTLRDMMDRVEKRILIQTLAKHGNNKTAAAKALGITREGLHKKLKGFGL